MSDITLIQEILDNAPEGATHVDNNGFYLKASTSGYLDIDEDGRDWDYDYANHCHTRSLADIKTILELQKENAILSSRIYEHNCRAIGAPILSVKREIK